MWVEQIIQFFDLRTLMVVALVFIPLERILALHPEQPIIRRYWWNDVFYTLFNRIPIYFGLAVILAAIATLATWLIPVGFRSWVGALPLWIQVSMAVLLADLGFYAAHRMFHAIPFLWRFHAVHHSIEEMDWLAASRVHPVDQIVTKGMSWMPLLLCGFSAEAIGIHAGIYFIQSIIVHSNIRLKIGPLRWIIASPEFHHWHHSNQREAYDTNFASQLPIIDYLFGTARMPKGEMPTHYGVNDPVPTSYLKQFTYPFTKKRKQTVQKPA